MLATAACLWSSDPDKDDHQTPRRSRRTAAAARSGHALRWHRAESGDCGLFCRANSSASSFRTPPRQSWRRVHRRPVTERGTTTSLAGNQSRYRALPRTHAIALEPPLAAAVPSPAKRARRSCSPEAATGCRARRATGEEDGRSRGFRCFQSEPHRTDPTASRHPGGGRYLKYRPSRTVFVSCPSMSRRRRSGQSVPSFYPLPHRHLGASPSCF